MLNNFSNLILNNLIYIFWRNYVLLLCCIISLSYRLCCSTLFHYFVLFCIFILYCYDSVLEYTFQAKIKIALFALVALDVGRMICIHHVGFTLSTAEREFTFITCITAPSWKIKGMSCHLMFMEMKSVNSIQDWRITIY